MKKAPVPDQYDWMPRPEPVVHRCAVPGCGRLASWGFAVSMRETGRWACFPHCAAVAAMAGKVCT